MIKIWGKILSNDKIIKSKTIKVDTENTTFFDMLASLSHALNIPTPVLLDKHVYDFNVFSTCFFNKDDFIEDVLFDRFVISIMRSV